MKPVKTEIRVWEGSPIAGKSVGEIEDKFGVRILKVTRGKEARNPPRDLTLDEADYIYFAEEPEKSLKLVRFAKTIPIKHD